MSLQREDDCRTTTEESPSPASQPERILYQPLSKVNSSEQVASEIAQEVVRRYLPEMSPDIGRGRRCVEYIETAVIAALDARVEECAVIAAAHFDDGDNHVGEHIAAALRNLKSSSDGGDQQ